MKLMVLSPWETFKGLSYGDWAAVWCNWFFSKDVDNYDGQDMLFLRGHVNYKPVSEIEDAIRYQDPDSYLNKTDSKGQKILEGTSIFVPITVSFNVIGEYFEGKLIENEIDLRNAVNNDINHVRSMWATVQTNDSSKNVKIVSNLGLYRVESPLFRLTVSRDSALNDLIDYPLKPGTHDAITAGFFLLLRELPPSSYRLDFGSNGPGDYGTRSIYDITIYNGKAKAPEDISGSIKPNK